MSNRRSTGGTGRKGNSSRSAREVPVNPSLIYSLREIWSISHPLWKRYEVDMPRLPTDVDDIRWVDMSDNQPKSFSGFVGNHNKECFAQLDHLIETFGMTLSLPDVLVISGVSGTGKSAATKVVIRRLIDEQNLSTVIGNKWCMQINARDYHVNDLMTMWNKIAKFAETPMERAFRAAFRYLVIDNFDHIPPSSQQHFKKILLTAGNTLRCLLVCPEPRQCMISFLTSKAHVVRTKPIAEADALSVLLSICCRNRIGYEADGIHELVRQFPDFSLSRLLDAIQGIFLESHYVSAGNVLRYLKKSPDLPVVSSTAAIEPISRCPLCTLMPPCQHISADKMLKLSQERRAALPRYKNGSMTCPEFARTGHCTMFNILGHCSLDHPKQLHKVDQPVRRCGQCTIPWPCSHCSYNVFRNQLRNMIESIDARLVRLRQINVPDPPLAFTKHLEHHHGWKEEVARIDRVFNIPDNLKALKAVTDWMETSFSTNSVAYQNRCKSLSQTFGDLYTTDLLETKTKAHEASPQSHKT